MKMHNSAASGRRVKKIENLLYVAGYDLKDEFTAKALGTQRKTKIQVKRIGSCVGWVKRSAPNKTNL